MAVEKIKIAKADLGIRLTDTKNRLLEDLERKAHEARVARGALKPAGRFDKNQDAANNAIKTSDDTIAAIARDIQYVKSGGWDAEETAKYEAVNEPAALKADLTDSTAEIKGTFEKQGAEMRQMGKTIGEEKSLLTAPDKITAGKVNRTIVGKIKTMEAAKLDPVADAEAATMGTVRDATAAQIAPMSQSEIAQIAKTDPVRAAKIERAQEQQVRAQQQTLIGQLQAQSAGEGPSLAGAQLKTAQNRNLAQQLAIAGQSRGGNAALQQRQLQQNMAVSGQELANQSAQARMQEQLSAREQLANVLQTTRGQDTNLATSQAGLEQAAFSQTSAQDSARNLTQGGIDAQTMLANTAAINNAKIEQSKLNQQVELTNVKKDLEIAQQNGNWRQAANLANQAKNLTVSITNATAKQNANAINVQSSATEVGTQAGIDSNIAQSEFAADISAQEKNQQNKFVAEELALKEKSFKDSRMDKYLSSGLSLEQAAVATDADLSKFMLNFGLQKQAVKTGESQFSQQLRLNQQALDQSKPTRKAGPGLNTVVGGLKVIGGAAAAYFSGGTLAAPAMALAADGAGDIANDFSDKRIKKDIEPGSGDIKEFLDALSAHKYKYQEPDMPLRGHGEYVTVMAQELEKTKIGKQMVSDTPTGKVVHYGKGFGAILAAQAELNKRLNELESKKKGK